MAKGSHSNDLAAFLGVISSLGADGAHIVPPADAEDLAKGAEGIPGEVTDARRAGQEVSFVQVGAKAEWYWRMPNGEKILHG